MNGYNAKKSGKKDGYYYYYSYSYGDEEIRPAAKNGKENTAQNFGSRFEDHSVGSGE